MDPLSALAVVAATVQFIDFSAKLISQSFKIYKGDDGNLLDASSAVDQQNDSATVAEHLIQLNQDIRASRDTALLNQEADPDQEQLRHLCDECDGIARQVLSALEALKRGGKPTAWRSFRLALHTIWSKEDVKKLEARLEIYRRQIAFHMLVAMRKQQAQFEDGLKDIAEDVQKKNDMNQELIVKHVKENRAWQRQVLGAIRSAPRTETSAPKVEKREKFAKYILELLHFSSIASREERIPEAYQATFKWIFEHPQDEDKRPWTDFVQWLQDDSSIYWITGKAGSGKSTLMKMICADPRTAELLTKSSTADPPEILVARYFFWNSGVKLQMTQEGLLRTLLYQLINYHDELAFLSFPERWEYYKRFGIYDSEPMNLHELQRSIMTLLTTTSIRRYVFFIDGLDEFLGDHADLVAFIQKLCGNTNVKVCLSSRPWNVFEDAFKRGPSLRLEYLTYNDFIIFVESNFSESEGYTELQEEGEEEAKQLMRAIAEKASGVFLWVNLVVRSLLAGMRDGERLSDLHRRLDALPEELENLFQKMMDAIKPESMQHASQLFQIVRAAKEPLTVICLAWADEDDPRFPFDRSIELLSDRERDAKAARMRRRLNSCCQGLLEASNSSLSQGKVEYIHRTVRDFLYDEQTWGNLTKFAQGEFNPRRALCNAYLLQLKTSPPPSIEHKDYERPLDNGSFYTILPWFIQYAHEFHEETGKPLLELYEELSRTVQTLVNPQDACQKSICWCKGPADHPDGPMLAFAVSLQIQPYLNHRLEQHPIKKQSKGSIPLLQTAVTDFQPFTELISELDACCHSEPNPRLIRLLLQRGADPNYSRGERTPSPWEAVITSSSMQWLPEVYQAFLQHGADPWVDLSFLRTCRDCGEALKQYILVFTMQKTFRKKEKKWYYRYRWLSPEVKAKDRQFCYVCSFCSGKSWLIGMPDGI